MPPKIDWKAVDRQIKALNAKRALAIGHAVQSWNMLHDALGAMFADIAQPKGRGMAGAVWHSQDSDRSQRKMLLAAAKMRYGDESRLYHDIKFICDAANRIADDRNVMIHVAYDTEALDQTFEAFKLTPRGAGYFGLPDRWQNRDVLVQIDAIEQSAITLFGYAMELMPVIAFREQFQPEPHWKAKPDELPAAWPHRPFLPKAPVPPTPAKDNPPPRKKRPPHPPPTSQG